MNFDAVSRVGQKRPAVVGSSYTLPLVACGQAKTARQAALAGVEKRYAEYSAAYDAATDAYSTYKSATTPVARAKAAGAYQLAYKKVANLESLTRQVYAGADAGAFVPLPALDAPKP